MSMNTERALIICCFAAFCLASCGGSGPKEGQTPSESSGSTGTVTEGEALIEKGDFKGAHALFEAIVSETPDNAKAYYYLAYAKRNLGDIDGAIANYETAIGLDDKLMNAHINLGLLLLEKGDLKGAEKEAGIYLAASPDASDAHLNYGEVQAALNNLDEAKKHYSKAAELDPEDSSPVFALADLARKTGDLETAVEMYEKARGIDPNTPELLYLEAQTLLELKDSGRACEVLLELLNITPVNLDIISSAGKMIAKQDSQCAIKLYRGAISADDNYATAHFYLANTLAREKQFEEAATHYEKFLAIAPDDDPAVGAAKQRLEGCRANLSK